MRYFTLNQDINLVTIHNEKRGDYYTSDKEFFSMRAHPWSQTGIVLRKGTLLSDEGCGILERRIAQGSHAGLIAQIAEFAENCPEVRDTGVIHISGSSAGWNASYSVYPIGPEIPADKWPARGKQCYRLKPGETFQDIPYPAPEAEVLAWIAEREARWYSSVTATKPVRFFPKENDLMQVQILDDFVEILEIDLQDLTYSYHKRDDGAHHRREGFYLGMPLEEAKDLGERLYTGFSWTLVESRLKTMFVTQSWISPPVWVKEQVPATKRRRADTVRKQVQYVFAIKHDLITNSRRVYVSVKDI